MLRRLVYSFRRLARYLPAMMLWAAFPPLGETNDVFFALAPLVWYARNRTPRQSARLWFANGMLYWIATLAWMPAIVKNGGPWPLVALGWGLLSAYCALYFAAFGWMSSSIWNWMRGRWYGWRLFAILAVEPVLWAGFELARSRLFGGFAWNQTGVALANGGFGAPASLGGVYLLGAVAMLVNGTAASIADRVLAGRAGVPVWRVHSLVRCAETVLPFAAIAALYAAAPRAGAVANPEGGGRRLLNAALVQRNFPCVFNRGGNRGGDPYPALFRSVSAAAPDLVVLPESALAEHGDIGSGRAAAFATAAMRETGAKAVLAGGSRSEGTRLYNSAALYDADGGLQIYDKVHLVPFGEYVPGDKIFPALQKLAPVGSCTPGEPRLLDFEGLKLAVAICFEDTDSALVRRGALDGADALVFITNDSWFSHSTEALQHAWQATARAIETGLPVLRAGNSGVTGAIAPDGTAQWLSDADGTPLVDAAGAMTAVVECAPAGAARAATPYARWGDTPLAAAFLLLIAAAFLVEYGTRYGKDRAIVPVRFGQGL